MSTKTGINEKRKMMNTYTSTLFNKNDPVKSGNPTEVEEEALNARLLSLLHTSADHPGSVATQESQERSQSKRGKLKRKTAEQDEEMS